MSGLIRREPGFPFGYTTICEIGGRHGEMGMDFGILRLKAGQRHALAPERERA